MVHVAYEDAHAYAGWAGLALPGEGEWEVAARGGLTGAAYTWGEESERPGQRLANFWHGDFPWRPEPGYGRTSPVGSFEPNGYGLFDMAGNVWEWTVDWYTDTPRPGPPPRRLVLVCRQLLPSVPAGRSPPTTDRYRHSHIGVRCIARDRPAPSFWEWRPAAGRKWQESGS
ncbi:Serine/threonine-protein kinase pkn1 [Mycobacterium marinum]|nr:Serine/threonine-protein kinase pkn1 [Mycobacterium marinum]RFZ06074.1 Serine/threonine-protein kinase pkn1 [Mycobacterium marinum]CDM78365.1 gliding motility-associated lipoprotein GldK [Mycobacterium marinum E11]